jgi:hypothetical protein
MSDGGLLQGSATQGGSDHGVAALEWSAFRAQLPQFLLLCRSQNILDPNQERQVGFLEFLFGLHDLINLG